jgi:hypothetical protein
MKLFDVGDLVQFVGFGDVFGPLQGSIGVVVSCDPDRITTIGVKWMSGLLTGQTTAALIFNLELISEKHLTIDLT